MTEAPQVRWPAEFEPHEATWLAWPHDERTWIAGLEEARQAVARMVWALSRGETVHLLVRPQDRSEAEAILSTRSVDDLVLHEKDHADAWLRDTGPTVVHRGDERAAIDWRFDAWGGKYKDLERDDDLAAFVAEAHGLPRTRVEAVCEGGAIETDGQGTVLTTRECLIEGRGHASEAAVDALFERVLGAEEVVWLEAGLPGDDTDGHIDTVARFVDPDTLALATADPGQPAHEPLAANREALAARGDLDVVGLPQPDPVTVRGSPRPATYANFAIGNEVVLLPVYDDPNDEVAHQRLTAAFGDRRIVPIPAEPLVAGYGACHCLTQQIPTPP